MLSKDGISKWLADLHLDRDWLAAQCGASKRTVDSWFSSRGFPPWALMQIERLMRETTGVTGGKFRVTFDTEEFERIDAARRMVGDPPRPQFYRDAIIAFADGILAGEAAAPENVKPMRYPSDPAKTMGERAAEEAPHSGKWRKKSAG